MSSERARAAVAACLVVLGGCTATQARPQLAARDCALPLGEELVDVRKMDRSIRVELRYATENNFTGERLPGYDATGAGSISGIEVLRRGDGQSRRR